MVLTILKYSLQVIEEVDDDDEEEEEGGEQEEEDVEEEGELVPEVSSDEGELSPVKPQRGAATSQSKKFASLSALESRPSRAEEVCFLLLASLRILTTEVHVKYKKVHVSVLCKHLRYDFFILFVQFVIFLDCVH